MAGQINEDMSLVANGNGGEVVDYYGLVNISDPSKVGTQGSEDEKQVRTDALVNNVWAAAVLVGQIQDAEKKLIKLVGMHRHLYSLRYTLAVAYVAQGRLQEGKRELRRCSTPLTDKQAAKMRKSDAAFMLPHCRAGYISLARLTLRMTSCSISTLILPHLPFYIDFFSVYWWGWCSLATVLIKQGHCEEALEVLLKALDVDPWFAPLHSALAAGIPPIQSHLRLSRLSLAISTCHPCA